MTLSIYDILPFLNDPTVAWPLAIICLWLSVLTNATEHGFIYDSGHLANLDLHAVDAVQEYAYYGLFLLAGINVVLALGASMVVRPAFQGIINWSVGRNFLDATEAPTWRLLGVSVPKPFYGKRRLIGMAIGALLMMFYVPITRVVLGVVI